MGEQKGVVHPTTLILVIGVLAIWLIVAYLLISKGIIKKTPFTTTKEPTVSLKTEYKNPFDKKTQYVNPFDQFKNPFGNLR